MSTSVSTPSTATERKTELPPRIDGSHLVACFADKYDDLLQEKVTRLRDLLGWKSDIDIFESPKYNYRMRTNFQMWHDDPKDKTVRTGVYYSMCDDSERRLSCEVKSFPRGSKLINTLMDQLMEVIQESNDIFENMFEVRFVTTQTEQAVITLCYKKPLSPTWLASAEEASKKLKCTIIGRARKMVQIAGGDEFVIEKYNVKGDVFSYYQLEGAFTQPNAAVCEKMLTWASDRTEGSSGEDLLELYCGGGTFTVPMAKNFRRVLATEISKASVELAHKNFALNGVKNVKVIKLSSEEFSDVYSGHRVDPRLNDAGISFKNYEISTVLVDPPRAGLDENTCKLISQFEKIVYISCNPETLARDVKMLLSTHTVQRVAAFDQFPYTHHLESGVFLVRRTDAAAETAEADAGAEHSEKKQRTV
jgi:tRNA (uracil-5-)-methyltransferase